MHGARPTLERKRDRPTGRSALSYWTSAEGVAKLLLRMVLGFSLGGAIYGGYFLLQRLTIRPVWWLEPNQLESWLPTSNSAGAVLLYLSFYLLTWVPGFLRSDREFRRFLLALAIIGIVSLSVFLLIPSGVLRPAATIAGASPAYLDLIKMDLPRNAFPSLHASVSTLAGIAGLAVFQSRLARSLLWLWVAAILWSTMATRQHVLFDVVTGAVLALAAWIIADRWLKGDTDEVEVESRP